MIRVSKIETMGMFDGPGIRVVIFLQGCTLRCIYCHNPETWHTSSGSEYQEDELLKLILKYKNYIKGNGGVTFSGGEPLFQCESLILLCKKLKENNIDIALDTSGIGKRDSYKELLKYIDLVILDIKAVDFKSYKYLTKGNIKGCLEFLKEVENQKKKLWIRSVIVPGINDNDTYINDLIYFLKDISNIERVELLPYHTLGESKYEELGIYYPLKNVKPLDKEIILAYQDKIDNELNLVNKDVDS